LVDVCPLQVIASQRCYIFWDSVHPETNPVYIARATVSTSGACGD